MNENDKTTPENFEIKGRPECEACGDPVKLMFYNGVPTYAQHCKECYAELRFGKIPRQRNNRRTL